MANWTDDELTVLLAIFISQPFKAGDDQQEVNREIARAFGRTPSAIDAQWRNIKFHLFRLDLYKAPMRHFTDSIPRVVDRYRANLGSLRQDALDAIETNGWGLEDLV